MSRIAVIMCAFLFCSQVSSVSASVLIFSGATYRSLTGYNIVRLPHHESFDTKVIYRLDYLNPGNTDSIVYDFSTSQFLFYESTSPYDLITTHDDFRIYDFVSDVALFNEQTSLLDVNPSAEEVNQVGALVFVGRIRFGALLNSRVVGEVQVNDIDGDAISDDTDNCPTILNPKQNDTDVDGYGDMCDPTLPSDINFDDAVELLDVIDALQITSGTAGGRNVFKAAAVSGDGMIGLSDAINGLTYISNHCNGADCYCGDNHFDPQAGEECDDGGESATCNSDCTVAWCGDGLLNMSAGESCDDSGESPSCNYDCSPSVCGDHILNVSTGEECDDGNAIVTDACLNNCAAATCGDGYIRIGWEECDDNNSSNTDSCVECVSAVCGDGYIWAGNESCDDGNTNNSDFCIDNCESAYCGDEYVWTPKYGGTEQCDDGGESATCDIDCTDAFCGDGITNTAAGEECDDGNSNPLDGYDNCIVRERP